MKWIKEYGIEIIAGTALIIWILAIIFCDPHGMQRHAGFGNEKSPGREAAVPGVYEIQQMLIERGYLDVNDPNATDGRLGPVTLTAWDRCICDQYAAGVQGAVQPYTQVPQWKMEQDYGENSLRGAKEPLRSRRVLSGDKLSRWVAAGYLSAVPVAVIVVVAFVIYRMPLRKRKR